MRLIPRLTLIALATAVAALGIAGPASAEDNPAPILLGCQIKSADGNVVTGYSNGETIIWVNASGRHKYKCENGKWVLVWRSDTGKPGPVRRIVGNLSSPVTNPRGPVAPILGGVLKPPSPTPSPTTPPINQNQ